MSVGSDLQVIVGKDGYFQWVSPSAKRILGWTTDEMMARPWTDYVHPDDLDRSNQEADRLFAGHRTYVFENRFRHKDGTHRWLFWRGQVDPEQQVIYSTASDITEHKQAELALRASEQRFRLLAEVSPVGIYRNDSEGRCIYANPKTLEITGLSLEDNLGDGWGKNLHPEDRDRLYETWLNFVEQTRRGHYPTYQVEQRYLYGDGSMRWAFTQAVPEYNAQGEVVGFIGSITDITDRKQVEAALSQSEERWQLAIRGSNNGIWDWNIKTNQAFRSERFYEILGFSNQELGSSEQSWIGAVHPEDVERVKTAKQAYLNREIPAFSIEYRLRCKDRTYKWVLDQAIAIWDEQGNPVRMVGALADISDRKRMEVERQRAQEDLSRELSRSKALFKASWDGIVVLDEKGYVVEANESYARMLGWSIEETLTLHVSDWDAQWTPEELDAIVVTKRFVGSTFETVHRRKDGSTYDVEITVSGVDLEDEFLTLCICRDITERKRREANAAFLAEINLDFSTLSSADEIMKTVAAKTGAYLRLSACVFAEFDQTQEEAVIHYAWHAEDGLSLIGAYPLSEFFKDDFLQDCLEGKPFIVCSTETEPRIHRDLYTRLNIHSFFTVPFHQDGQLRSLMAVYDAEPRQWFTDEIELVRNLTNQIFPRLERARAEDALKQHNEELEARVAERTAELVQSLAELEASREQLHHQAHHDSLTGLPNRLLFNLRFEQSLQQATRQQTKLAVVFIDLDRFKYVNDSLGHRCGDDLLQQVAYRLSQAIRINDSLARISGDEFVVLLTDLKDTQLADKAITRLMGCFESPFELDGHIQVTASVGICLFPDDGTDAETLLRHADAAMYNAKEDGRNTYCFYHPTMKPRLLS